MDYIILALATFRITSLLVNEDGPFGIFARLRTAAGVWVNKQSIQEADTFFGQLLICVWCTSVWVGVSIAVLYFITSVIAFWLALPFALSAAAIIFDGWCKHE